MGGTRSSIASMLAVASLCASLLLTSPVAAAADPTGADGAELVFHPGLEADLARGINELRAAYGLGPIEFRPTSELPVEFIEFRDCYMPPQFEQLDHDWHRCQPTDSADDYRGVWDILGSYGGSPDAGPGQILIWFHDSPDHLPVLLGDADWMTVYAGCKPDGNLTHQRVSIFFGSDDGHPGRNDVPRLNAPADDEDWSAWKERIDEGSDSCRTAPEPDADPPGVVRPIASETPADPASPETWGPFQIGRLYFAFFDRYPDAGGWVFWRRQLAGQQDLRQIAEHFVHSVAKGSHGNGEVHDAATRWQVRRLPVADARRHKGLLVRQREGRAMQPLPRSRRATYGYTSASDGSGNRAHRRRSLGSAAPAERRCRRLGAGRVREAVGS